MDIHPNMRDPSPVPHDLSSGDSVWQAAMDMLGDGVVLADAEGHVMYANSAARKMFGDDVSATRPEEWPARFGLHAASTLCAGLSPEAFPLVRALRGEHVHGEELVKTGAGKTETGRIILQVAAYPLSSPDGSVSGVVMLLRDVTPARESEEGIFLRDRAMAAAAEGITISDYRLPDNPLIYLNEGFERITGYSREEVFGRNCRFLQGPETNDDARAAIRKAIDEGRHCVVELKNFRKDGTPFWNRLSITPIHNAAGEVTHYIGVQSDITDRVEAERRLKETTDQLMQLNERLLHDLKAAAQIQRTQLPPEQLSIPGLKVAWRFQPCEALAGDMLNVVPLDDRHVAMYVLDVAGHGTASALLSTSVSRLLQPGAGVASLVYERRPGTDHLVVKSPAEIVKELNKTYRWDFESGQFFTIIYGVFDRETGTFRFASAGHPSLIVIPRSGKPRTFKSDGLPVGIENESYQETTVQLEPGTRVYLYSDGVIETMNPAGEIYGESRLVEILAKQQRSPLDDAVEHVIEDLNRWRGNDIVNDDMTLLAFEVQ